MFVTLLIVTLLIALATSLLVMRLFDRMIRKILDRLVSAELSEAWNRYLSFAVVVVGVSGGVRIWSLEKYITARTDGCRTGWHYITQSHILTNFSSFAP